MYRASIRALITTTALCAGLVLPRLADAAPRSFVTLRDDGSLSAKKLPGPDVITEAVMSAYDKAGMTRPDVLSLWTTFTTNGSSIETLFDPLANDVQGIGLETAYKTGDGTGVFPSSYAPTRAILLHNDMTALEARAKAQEAPADGLARYLFLLELSHLWGPAIRVPTTDAGGAPDALIGFDFHWSFWMDAGGSAAGGNAWKDNGDGSFTTSGASPKTITYSMLDLYLQGLADPSEVKPFGLLENVTPPADIMDPFHRSSPYSAQSFPWFGAQPFTVKATRRTITIEDVIAANGLRVPAKASGKLDLGIVLMVKPTATDAEIAALEARFEPIAASLAPAYHVATHERGTMTNVTLKDLALVPDAGTEPDPNSETPTPPAPSSTSETSGGCAVAPDSNGSLALVALVGVALLGRRRRKARRNFR